jgi:hypothetical protein
MRIELKCTHCAKVVFIPFHDRGLAAADYPKGWEKLYYMPFAGNYRLFCGDCIPELKRVMADFVHEVLP